MHTMHVDSGLSLVLKSLNRFLHNIIEVNSKEQTSSPNERLCTSIAHLIIAVCPSRSLISHSSLSIFLFSFISVNVHQRYSSRKFINVLSSISFADDYKEVQRLLSSIVLNDKPSWNFSGFSQCIFDYADFYAATISGHNTFHTKGGIVCEAWGIMSNYKASRIEIVSFI